MLSTPHQLHNIAQVDTHTQVAAHQPVHTGVFLSRKLGRNGRNLGRNLGRNTALFRNANTTEKRHKRGSHKERHGEASKIATLRPHQASLATLFPCGAISRFSNSSKKTLSAANLRHTNSLLTIHAHGCTSISRHQPRY